MIWAGRWIVSAKSIWNAFAFGAVLSLGVLGPVAAMPKEVTSLPGVQSALEIGGQAVVSVHADDAAAAMGIAVETARQVAIASFRNAAAKRRRLDWVKVNVSYGEGIGGSFGLIWHARPGVVAELKGAAAYQAIDLAQFDGANERSKIDLHDWCRGGGATSSPRFCRAVLTAICRGPLIARYGDSCRAAGLK